MANSVAPQDTGRIKRNVEKMISLGAPEAEIDGYLGTEGFTPQSFRQSMIEARQPQRTTGERVTRSLGLGARNVVEGLTAFPGMLYDAAMLPVKGVIGAANYMGADLPQVAPASETISNALTLAGAPKSENANERVLGRVVQGVTGALPTMGAGALMQGAASAPQVVRGIGGVLAANPATQVVSGGSAGLTGGLASEMGAGPVGDFAASMGGGMLGAGAMAAGSAAMRAVPAIVEPFRESGRQAIAGRAILESSADPTNLNTRINQGVSNPNRRLPGSPVTTAEAAQDTGLATLQSGMRNDPVGGQNSPKVLLQDVEARRNASRTNAIAGLNPLPGTDAATRGDTVRSVLSARERAAAADVDTAYKAIEAGGKASLDPKPLARAASWTATDTYGPGSGGVPKPLQDVLDEMATHPGGMSIEFLQNIRKRLGGVAGVATGASDNNLASAANRVRDAIDDAVNTAVANGQGVTQQQADGWRKAIAARREMGLTFDRDMQGTNATGRILDTAAFGTPRLPSGQVGDTALQSRQSVEQVLKAAGPEAPQVAQQLTAHLSEQLKKAAQLTGTMIDSAGNAQTPLSPAQIIKFVNERRPQMERVFPPDRMATINRLVSDLQETMAIANAGAARGSPTAQNLAVGNLISRTTNGLIDPGNPLAQTLAGGGGLMRLLYAPAETRTRELLAQALVDPQAAQRMLTAAGPQGANRANTYLNTTFQQRLADALMGGTARLGVTGINAALAQQ
jgi:hypothetical protein